MIARLRGRLDSIGEDHVVVDVGGVGYLVHCAARTLHALPRPGEAVDLLIETQVREEISYTASDRDGESVVIDPGYVRTRVAHLVEGADLSKFIL